MTDQSDPAVTSHRPRRRWLAALASLCLPGLGQLYAGKPWRAACWFAVQLLLSIAIVSTYWWPLGRGLTLALFALVMIELVCAVDAWRQAARQQDYRLKPYNRWWVYHRFDRQYARDQWPESAATARA